MFTRLSTICRLGWAGLVRGNICCISIKIDFLIGASGNSTMVTDRKAKMFADVGMWVNLCC